VEAARPLVFATALLLVSVIAILNLTAAVLRNRLRENFRSLEI
jgi:phosphate transport system permease protein